MTSPCKKTAHISFFFQNERLPERCDAHARGSTLVYGRRGTARIRNGDGRVRATRRRAAPVRP